MIKAKARRILGNIAFAALIPAGGYAFYQVVTADPNLGSYNHAVYRDINNDGLADIIVETPVKYKVFLQDRDGIYRFTADRAMIEGAAKIFEKE